MQKLILTISLQGPVIPSGSYSNPNNGASNQAIETNMYMYWSDQISTTGATGTITLRSGSPSGSVIPASITVTSNYIYANPTSDLPYSTTIYMVVGLMPSEILMVMLLQEILPPNITLQQKQHLLH